MKNNVIGIVNAGGTALLFLGCSAVILSKIVSGEELFLRHYMLVYFAFFCLAVSVVSIARLRNDKRDQSSSSK